MVKSLLDHTFTALADPARRAIVATLAAGPRTVGELAAPLPMSLVAASKHISVLERAGLVSRTRSGRTQVCRLHPGALREATLWLDTYRGFWSARLDSPGGVPDGGRMTSNPGKPGPLGGAL
jgi:DNA-binding transcriptional ArsR family regulator